jgi:hypothetical protein
MRQGVHNIKKGGIMGKYIAIIADIKQSRASGDRKNMQEKLMSVLDSINNKYRDVIASKFYISSGDSFQGLLKSGENIMDIIINMELALYPLKLRLGIGIGGIDTAIYEDNSNLVDGKAYHMARQCLEEVKENENKNERVITSYKIAKYGSELPLINTLFSLVSIIKDGWSESQVNIIKAYIENGCNQKNTAEYLGKNQSTISYSLKGSQFYSLSSAFDVLSSSIEKERVSYE